MTQDFSNESPTGVLEVYAAYRSENEGMVSQEKGTFARDGGLHRFVTGIKGNHDSGGWSGRVTNLQPNVIPILRVTKRGDSINDFDYI
jgi:hypothetical protein